MYTETKQPHKHAELIIAWAKGAEIECRVGPFDNWTLRKSPVWSTEYEYRIKPEPKLDVIRYINMQYSNYMKNDGPSFRVSDPLRAFGNNIELCFDGDTNKLKSVSLVTY